MMGNIQAESGMIPNRVEVLCLQRLREIGKYYTDATYTAFVDDGTISREQFLHPLPGRQYGYGLCQWTSPGRKAGLYDLCKKKKVSIGDLETQLEYLITELRTSYPGVFRVLSTTNSINEASDKVLMDFEQPGDCGQSVKETRRKYSREFYIPDEDDEEVTGMTEAEAIDKVLSIALAEEGYHEKASAKNLNSKTANSGSANYTKYGKQMHALQPSTMDYPAAWCDCFVDWCFKQAFGADLARKMLCGTFDDYTVNSANIYKNANRWTQKAKKGHQVFFRNNSGICHTGLVYKVAGEKVYTIEGNSSDAVRKHEYYAGEWKIAGYGMPKYFLAVGSDIPSDTPSADPNRVTASQPAQSFNRKISGSYKTTADLNMRDGASTNFKILTTLPEGTVVQNYGYYTSLDGVKWLYVQVGINRVVYTGFCSEKYLKKQ